MKKPEKKVEIQVAPEPEKKLDYKKVPLEILHIQQLEEKPGPYNSYNPLFSADESFLSVEVDQGTFSRIFIYRLEDEDGQSFSVEKAVEISLEDTLKKQSIEDYFESTYQESFNYEFNWFPHSSSYIFTSNAGMGEYNIFVGSVHSKDKIFQAIRQNLQPRGFGGFLMMTEEVKKDGQAQPSPDGTKIVFTSGRTGNGDLYLLDLTTGGLRRLTTSEDTDFFPQWSPDGKSIVYTTGGKQSHDINIIRNVGSDTETDEVLVKWFFNDILPTFSPDGEKIAFYSTYNLERDPFNTKRWGLMVIPADGSAPSAGKDLVDYFYISDVVKDNTQGTAWFPDSTHIMFAKNIDSEYNPIYIYNIETRDEYYIDTGTNINHDITVSPHGLVSFRAQVLGWDRIFIGISSFYRAYQKENA
jgi:Tol biopolymer transport system component